MTGGGGKGIEKKNVVCSPLFEGLRKNREIEKEDLLEQVFSPNSSIGEFLGKGDWFSESNGVVVKPFFRIVFDKPW